MHLPLFVITCPQTEDQGSQCHDLEFLETIVGFSNPGRLYQATDTELSSKRQVGVELVK